MASSLLVIGIVINHTILGNGGVGEEINLGTLSTHSTKGVACLASIGGVAGRVNLVTESFGTLGRARQIRTASVIGDVASVLDKLIGTSVISTVARSSSLGSTVQYELDGKVDIVALSLAGNLDAIGKAAEGAMGPTRSTVLRNVLVETLGQVTYTIDVAPRERVGQVLGHQVRVRKRIRKVVVHGIVTDLREERTQQR
jgi:hypothetical protein